VEVVVLQAQEVNRSADGAPDSLSVLKADFPDPVLAAGYFYAQDLAVLRVYPVVHRVFLGQGNSLLKRFL
jgi:hypothetical protein